MKRQFFTLLAGLLCLSGSVAQAAKVDTLSVRSNAMNKNVTVLTVRPDKAVGGEKCPVIYLLHGHGGNAFTWMTIKPDLPQIADREGIIFVCPDGKNSWYWDSPVNPSYRYETFVAKELVNYIDANYPTIKDRTARAITGLSMGGHGAMWLSFRHKDIFGAAGSTSGGVDIRPFPNNWNMSEWLGKESENQEVWEKHTVINLVEHLKNGDLALIFDCGYSDFFFEVNNNFHEKLLKYKIDHDFIVRPGAHNGDYWRNSIDYQIVFFNKFFNRNK